MASELFFEEDEVSILTEKEGLRCGLIVESSEYISSDEDDDDEGTRGDGEYLRRGMVRVSWHPDGREQVITEAELRLDDRSLMPGDVVRRFILGEDSQRGYATMTRIRCHLQVIGQPAVICDVDSRDLLPITPFNIHPGDVYLDSWVGKLVNVLERLTLRFSDGARCEVTDEETVAMLLEFTDIYDKQSRDFTCSQVVFYEGQVLKGDLGCFQDVKWLRPTKRHNKRSAVKCQDRDVIVTVEKAETYQLEVNWICRGFSRQESAPSTLQPPPRMIKGEALQRIKQLDCFEACSYKMGERALYVLKDSDEVIILNDKDRHSSMHQVMTAKGKCGEANNLSSAASNLKVLKSKSENSVQVSSPDAEKMLKKMPDGAAAIHEASPTADSLGVESTSSQSKLGNEKKPKGKQKRASSQIHQLKAKNLKPAKKKMQAPSPDVFSVKAGQQLQVEVIHTSTMVDVMWQDGTKELEIVSTELLPVHHLDELEFFPGDYVVSGAEIQVPGVYGVIQSVDHGGRTCRVKWLQHSNASSIDTVLKEDEVSVYDIKDHPDLKFRTGQVVVRVSCEDSVGQTSEVNENLPSVGQVYELSCDGPMTIQWHDGSKSMCYPLQLYLIGDEMSDLYSNSGDSFSSNESTSTLEWETEEELPLEDDSNLLGSTAPENLNGLDEYFFDRLKETVKKLEELVASLESKGLPTTCNKFAKYLLQLFRLCTDFDDAFGMEFFAGKELAAAMAEMKRLSRKSKTTVVNGLETSLKNAGSELQDDNKDQRILPPRVDESGNDSGLEKSPSTSELRDMETNVCDLSHEGTVAAALAPSSACSEIASKMMELNKSLNNAGSEIASSGDIQGSGKMKSAEEKADFKESLTANIAAVLVKLSELLKRTQNLWQDSESEEKRLCFNALKLLCGMLSSIPEHQMVTFVQSLCKKARKQSSEGNLPRKSVSDAACGTDDFDDKNPFEWKTSRVSTSDAACGTWDFDEAADPVPNSTGDGILLENSTSANGDKVEDEHTPTQTNPQELDLSLGDTPSDLVSKEIDVAPVVPLTPIEIRAKIEFNPDGFTLLDSLPEFHHYKDQKHVPVDSKTFNSTIRNEMKLLKSCLPNGIYIKGFESRMDLYSIMIEGPSRTPYEDGLFFFDVQLPEDYPSSPPLFFYISYCSDRLNPNLYEDGKVCVSLLGTWTGKGTEMWSSKSNLLQVLISIQGLILNPEPYYNEAGYERQKGTQIGHENSRMYNEMAIVKMVQSMTKIAVNPFQVFSSEIQSHLNSRAYRLINRLRYWIAPEKCCADSGCSSIRSNLDEKSEVMKTASDNASDLPMKSISSDLTINSNESEIVLKSQNSELSIQNDAKLNDNVEDSTGALSRYKIGDETSLAPAFPLLPASKGFKLSLSKCLDNFEEVLQSVGISKH